jgi:hypothetical protein
MARQTPFLFCKNPYHLFTSVRWQKFFKRQKDSAAAIKQMLPIGAPGISETSIGKFLEPAYVDLSSDRFASIHIPAMNKVLSSELQGVNIDLLDAATRIDLEETINYQFPDQSDFEANAEYNDLRGVWQLLHPSLKCDHITSGDQWVRSALLVIYGFITHRQKELEKKDIGLLIIGPSTIWRAHAWISAAQKLYIHAHDCVRHAKHRLFEDQFFVFDVSKPHDRYVREKTYAVEGAEYDKVDSMQGILSGASLDENWHSMYPAVAAPCVARKMNGWSEWLKLNDRVIDIEFASEMRKNAELRYYPLEELKAKSHNSPFDGALMTRRNQDSTLKTRSRNQEYWYKMDDILKMICADDGLLWRPILRRSNTLQ